MLLSYLSTATASLAAPRSGAKHLYSALSGEHGAQFGDIDEMTRATARAWLHDLLEAASRRTDALPSDPRLLPAWLEQAHTATASAYRDYLDERRAGAPRRFFRNRSHALHFLKSVAPTKLVDGAWLYGLMPRWADARLAPLIRIYLEELGNGVPAQHHVLIYRQMLAQHGTTRWQELDDAHYVQGAIQLALGHNGAELLPEVIGFNLGYEQLPLHLPITAYELNELDVDPWYFSLHVTIDNASTGHARTSLQCALAAMPRAGDSAAFYRRMIAGFRLNDVGMGTVQAIESFDLERELVALLADKAKVGAALHSDYCRIGGRTVADWLSEPAQLPRFLSSLQATGWIKRGQDPSQSRFWRLLHDERAPMFGVFSAYEEQLIRDWIVEGSAELAANDPPGGPRRAGVNRFRQRSAAAAGHASAGEALVPGATVHEIVRHHLADCPGDAGVRIDSDLRLLEQRLAGTTTRGDAMSVLRGFLSPANHATPAGLVATRIFASLFAARG